MSEQPKGVPPKNVLTLVIMAGVAVACVAAAAFTKENALGILGFGAVVCANLYTSYQGAQDNKEVKDTLLQASSEQKQEVLAVKETLATSTEDIKKAALLNADQQNRMEKTGDDTHYLVNGTMGANLFIIAELREEKADRTKKPSDREAAIEARKKYNDHMEQLKVIEATRAAQAAALAAPQEVTIVGQTDAVVVTTEGKKA